MQKSIIVHAIATLGIHAPGRRAARERQQDEVLRIDYVNAGVNEHELAVGALATIRGRPRQVESP